MARITVRNLDDSTMQRLRERGASRGVSMEQEARDILAAYVGLPTTEGFDYEGLVFPDSDEAEVIEAGDRRKTRS